MAFLGQDERVIVMDINRASYWGGRDYSLTVDELKRLRDAGIRTVLQQLWWNAIEKKRGIRDWSSVAVGLARARVAGMKVLLGCYQQPPDCLPEDWYLRTADGRNVLHLSLWNDEANEYEAGFVRDLAARFAGDGVLLQNTLICDGETMLTLEPSWYDPAALASLRAWTHEGVEPSARVAHSSGWLRHSIVEKMKQYQGLLLEVQDHEEVWIQLHPMIDKVAAGAVYAADVLQALREEWPGVEICWLLYTFYEFLEGFQQVQIELARRYDVRLIVGAGHCQGLSNSVPKAKKTGISLLCGPRHDHIMPDQHDLEPWMVERLQWAVKALGRRRLEEATRAAPERAVVR